MHDIPDPMIGSPSSSSLTLTQLRDLRADSHHALMTSGRPRPALLSLPLPEVDDFVDVPLMSSSSGSQHSSSAGLAEAESLLSLGAFQMEEPSWRQSFVSVGELQLSVQFGEQGDGRAVIIITVHSADNFPAYHGLSSFSKHRTKVHLELSISFEKAMQPVHLKSHTQLASTSMAFDENLIAVMSKDLFDRRRTLRIGVVEKMLSRKKVIGCTDIDISRLSDGHRISTDRYQVFARCSSPGVSGSPRTLSRSLTGLLGTRSTPGGLDKRDKAHSRGTLVSASAGSLV